MKMIKQIDAPLSRKGEGLADRKAGYSPVADNETESLINRSFLSRVPEILLRGGFTLQTAVEQAYREDEALCLELCDGGRTERARHALTAMSDRVYARFRS